MGDWDPFAVDDSAGGGAAPAASGVSFSLEDTYELAGSSARVVKRDFEKCIDLTWARLQKEEPWLQMPDPKPDLSWHTPSCTFEDWKHTAIKVKLGKSVVHLTFNKPDDGNKLAGEVVAALTDALFLLHAREDLRVAVFSGEGKLFCAGGVPDADGGGGFPASAPAGKEQAWEELAAKALKAGAFPDGQVNMGRLLQTRLWHTWATVPQFTICLANGSAMGEGMGCVCCCDYTVALEGSFFSLSDVRVGLVPAGVAPYVVAKTGTGVAKRIFCTSENMSAAKAVEAGIVDEVAASLGEAQELVRKLCAQISHCGPRTVAAAKELVLGVAGQQIIEPLMFYTGFMQNKVMGLPEAMQATHAAMSGKPKPWEEQPLEPAA